MNELVKTKLLDFLYYNYLLTDFLDEDSMLEIKDSVTEFLKDNAIDYIDVEIDQSMNINFIIERDVLRFAITVLDEDAEEDRTEFIIGVKAF